MLDIKATLGLRRILFTTHWTWRWSPLTEATHGSALVRGAVTSSETEMSDVGHSQHFGHAQQQNRSDPMHLS